MITKIAWKNIWFKPLNTALSIILLTASVAIITLLILLQEQFERKFSDNIEGIDLVLGAKGSPLQGRRRRDEESVDLKRITSSRAVFEIMQPIIGELPHEEFWILFLNNSNKVIYKSQISKGGITGTIVDARIVFKTALEHNATGIILVHNHPSGVLQESEPDRQITRQLKAGGDALSIKVLDHVIVTEKGYLSFADKGIL